MVITDRIAHALLRLAALLIGALLLHGCSDDQEQPAPVRMAAIATENRMALNSLTENRMALNALTANALVANELTLQAFLNEPLLSDAVTSTELSPSGEPVGELTVDFLTYVYSCAMPFGDSMDLVIGGTNYGTLQGSLGLAPQWGAAGGSCDVTCQRWVSACLLARTNLYGVTVPISLRGPHPALTVDATELATYPIREASFYGNVFVGPQDMNACTGPGNTLADVTARICGWAPGGSPTFCGFSVSGPCQDTICDPGRCAGSDGNGASTGCRDESNATWNEVITVYLQEPLAACDDGICSPSETAASCPGDCVPGWTQRVVNSPEPPAYVTSPRMAIDATGNIYVSSGITQTTRIGDVTVAASGGGYGDAFLAKLAPDGTVLWAVPIGCYSNTFSPTIVPSISLAPDGDVLLAAEINEATCTFGATVITASASASSYQPDLILARFSPDGQPRWARKISTTATVDLTDFEVGPDGRIAVAGYFEGSLDFGGSPLVAGPDGAVFAASFTADGEYSWGATRDTALTWQYANVATDGAGAVIFTAAYIAPGQTVPMMLEKRDATGAVVWTKNFGGGGAGSLWDYQPVVSADAAGNVWIAGWYDDMGWGGPDFGGGPLPEFLLKSSFLVRFAPDGTLLWGKMLGTKSWGAEVLAIDPDGNAIVAGTHDGTDLGGGPIPINEKAPFNIAVAKFAAADGAHLWSRNVASSSYWVASDTIAPSPTGDVVVLGDYQQFAVVNNRVMRAGEETNDECRDMYYVTSFPDPDRAPPVPDGGVDGGTTAMGDGGGCGCRTAPGRPAGAAALLMAVVALLLARRQRRP